MPTLQIVIASTRPGRVGLPVAEWVIGRARGDQRFELDVVDLAELGLPLMDEPNHPRLRSYTQQHTRDWSARVEAADAFVFVMPEYNHGYNAALKNSLDFLHQEWAHKPVGMVSYGGVAAGTRAVQALKPVLASLRMTPLVEAVPIPFVAASIDDEDRFQPSDSLESAAIAMFDELVRVERALRPLRGG